MELVPPGLHRAGARARPVRGLDPPARLRRALAAWSTCVTATCIWDEHTRIPVHPMVGTIGDRPAARLHQHDRQRASRRQHGRAGDRARAADVLPPRRGRRRAFFLGDCHAVQGDGELCGVGAIEIRTHTTVRLDLVPRPERMAWPRIETDEHIGAIACARPLEDAFRLAAEELVRWMDRRLRLQLPDAVHAARPGRGGALHAAREPEVHLHRQGREALPRPIALDQAIGGEPVRRRERRLLVSRALHPLG